MPDPYMDQPTALARMAEEERREFEYRAALERLQRASRETFNGPKYAELHQSAQQAVDQVQAALRAQADALDYRGRPPYQPEPRPTVRSVLAEMGRRDAIIIGLAFTMIGAFGYAVAVALGMAWR